MIVYDCGARRVQGTSRVTHGCRTPHNGCLWELVQPFQHFTGSRIEATPARHCHQVVMAFSVVTRRRSSHSCYGSRTDLLVAHKLPHAVAGKDHKAARRLGPRARGACGAPRTRRQDDLGDVGGADDARGAGGQVLEGGQGGWRWGGAGGCRKMQRDKLLGGREGGKKDTNQRASTQTWRVPCKGKGESWVTVLVVLLVYPCMRVPPACVGVACAGACDTAPMLW